MNKEMPTTASNVITLQESQELARAALRAYDPDFKPVSNRESLPKLRRYQSPSALPSRGEIVSCLIRAGGRRYAPHARRVRKRSVDGCLSKATS